MEPWKHDPEDLRHVLTGLKRDSPRTRDRTRGYLEAGVTLVGEVLGHRLESPEEHPLFRWLTKDRLIRAMRAQRPDDPTWGGEGSLRDRWARHRDYIADLITWLGIREQRQTYPERAPSEIQQAFESSEPASRLIQRIGRANLESLFSASLFRLQVFATVIAPAQSRKDASTARFYDQVEKRWLPIIRRVFKTYSLRLKPGVTERDLLEILTAVGEGLALRELADPSTGRRRQNRVKLQATTALALLVACTSDTDETLEQSLDRMVMELRARDQ